MIDALEPGFPQELFSVDAEVWELACLGEWGRVWEALGIEDMKWPG